MKTIFKLITILGAVIFSNTTFGAIAESKQCSSGSQNISYSMKFDVMGIPTKTPLPNTRTKIWKKDGKELKETEIRFVANSEKQIAQRITGPSTFTTSYAKVEVFVNGNWEEAAWVICQHFVTKALPQ